MLEQQIVQRVSIELLTLNSITHIHYFVLESLKEMQAEINIKISTIQNNISKTIPSMQKINHVIKLYDQFKIYCNVLNFLSGTILSGLSIPRF
jgi:predicted DNA-binding protein YlxM (UPF0122 family)